MKKKPPTLKNLQLSLFFILLSLIISGCETVPPQSITSVQWQSHQTLLANIDTFEANGKIGFRSPKERLSVNFNWKHSPNESQLRLINFLGNTVLTLVMTPQGAQVTTSDDQVYQHKNANTLFYNLTGISFPVTQMQDWIKGQPTQADSYALNETHTLSSLTKRTGRDTWRMSYTSYQDIEQIPFPYQMSLKQTDTSVKIVVSKWVIN